MREFDWKEMSEFDGKDGKPIYIVHQGKVFDVSQSKLWRGGLHMKRHRAAMDLTTDIGGAPHGAEVLERYPQVGVVREEETADERTPEWLSKLLKRVPMLRRHLHPMTVHFPIVFMLSATIFTLLYLITGVKALETTALHCLAAGVISTPAVILTGLFTWWLNYMAKPLRPVNIKIVVSLVLFVIALLAFTWRVAVPGILDSFSPESMTYFLAILSLTPLVSVIGWFGAAMTFPIEKE
jgi:predicted heme/steroid binding protein/uncharacterized membrane protein